MENCKIWLRVIYFENNSDLLSEIVRIDVDRQDWNARNGKKNVSKTVFGLLSIKRYWNERFECFFTTILPIATSCIKRVSFSRFFFSFHPFPTVRFPASCRNTWKRIIKKKDTKKIIIIRYTMINTRTVMVRARTPVRLSVAVVSQTSAGGRLYVLFCPTGYIEPNDHFCHLEICARVCRTFEWFIYTVIIIVTYNTYYTIYIYNIMLRGCYYFSIYPCARCYNIITV